MDEAASKIIHDLAYGACETLYMSLSAIPTTASNSEAENLDIAIHNIVADIYIEILRPIHKQYPHLKPKVDEETNQKVWQNLLRAISEKGIKLSDSALEFIKEQGIQLPDSFLDNQNLSVSDDSDIQG
jgi:hypothetical protein